MVCPACRRRRGKAGAQPAARGGVHGAQQRGCSGGSPLAACPALCWSRRLVCIFSHGGDTSLQPLPHGWQLVSSLTLVAPWYPLAGYHFVQKLGLQRSSGILPTCTLPKSTTCLVPSRYVTPPPCFVARRPVHLETSPLENLLIEHPSMSVYGPCPRAVPAALRKSRGLGAARKDGEAESQPALQSPVVSVAAPEGHAAQVLTTGRSMPGPRPSALAARAGEYFCGLLGIASTKGKTVGQDFGAMWGTEKLHCGAYFIKC